jgi:hypothetical protein
MERRFKLTPACRRRAPGLQNVETGGLGQRSSTSFSEEKEAKRLL